MPRVRVLQHSFLAEGQPEFHQVKQSDKTTIPLPKPYGRIYDPEEEVVLPFGTELGPNLEVVDPDEHPAAPPPVRAARAAKARVPA